MRAWRRGLALSSVMVQQRVMVVATFGWSQLPALRSAPTLNFVALFRRSLAAASSHWERHHTLCWSCVIALHGYHLLLRSLHDDSAGIEAVDQKRLGDGTQACSRGPDVAAHLVIHRGHGGVHLLDLLTELARTLGPLAPAHHQHVGASVQQRYHHARHGGNWQPRLVLLRRG